MSALTRLGITAALILIAMHPSAAEAQDPCAAPHARALVLGTGGSKGAFEAGAAYHLIVHRGCDFNEISGTSVGALNGALLAQAAKASDPQTSIDNLQHAAENLVDEWSSIESAKDMMRSRPLSRIRLGVFGLDSLKDFEPLREFVRTRVDLDRLATGRELRVGTTSFDDGRYHEIVLNANGRVDHATAHTYIFGSAIVPVFGEMPIIADQPREPPAERHQFADGGVRHSAPVTSYFESCRPNETGAQTCAPLAGYNTPPHPRTEQLFVVVTSPYSRRNDFRPVVDPKAFDDDTHHITDGRQILVRMFDLLIDTMSRDDLDDMLMLNDLLQWRAQTAARLSTSLPDFPIESFNRPADGTASRPYAISLVAPQREDADPAKIFDANPETISRQLYCGCIAADAAMQRDFGLAPLANRCSERFPRPTATRDARARVWQTTVCRDRTAVP